MSKMRLAPPWYEYQNKLQALFEKDPEIEIGQLYDGENGDYDLWIYVNTEKKYKALKALLPATVAFGNVKVRNVLKFRDNSESVNVAQAVRDLFEGNTAVFDIQSVSDFTGTEHMFVRFRPEVIQFYNDDTSDMDGNWSGLAQTLAREILDTRGPGIFFTTAPKDQIINGTEAN